MSNEKKVEKGNKNFLSGLFRQQIFIPIAALIILAVFNLIVDPSFFKITLGYNSAGDPVLSGYLMTILDYGSELAILAIGMTLVTAASGAFLLVGECPNPLELRINRRATLTLFINSLSLF